MRLSKSGKEFIIIMCLLLVGRLADFWSTYVVSPDLEYEMNPIVSVFGGGWFSLILSNLIITSLTIVVNYYQLFIYTPPPVSKPVSIERWQDVVKLYCSKKNFWHWTIGIPRTKRDWTYGLYLLGYMLPRMLIVMSFYVAFINNLLLGEYLWHMHIHIPHPWVAVALLTVISIYYFFYERVKKDYKKIKNSNLYYEN